MHIDIYDEEITDDVEFVGSKNFTGVRFYLKSPDDLLALENKDRNAVTFWLKNRKLAIKFFSDVVDSLIKDGGPIEKSTRK